MSRRDRRAHERARAITKPLVDPPIPTDLHRGVAEVDRKALGEPTGHIRVDGQIFAYWMPNGQPLTPRGTP